MGSFRPETHCHIFASTELGAPFCSDVPHHVKMLHSIDPIAVRQAGLLQVRCCAKLHFLHHLLCDTVALFVVGAVCVVRDSLNPTCERDFTANIAIHALDKLVPHELLQVCQRLRPTLGDAWLGTDELCENVVDNESIAMALDRHCFFAVCYQVVAGGELSKVVEFRPGWYTFAHVFGKSSFDRSAYCTVDIKRFVAQHVFL